MYKRLRYLTYFLSLSFFAYHASQIEISDDIAAAMLAKDVESYSYYENYLAQYPNDLAAYLVLEDVLCKPGGAELLERIADTLSLEPIVYRAQTLTSPSTKFVKNVDGETQVQPFADYSFVDNEELCAAASAYGPYQNALVAREGGKVAIYVIADESANSQELADLLNQTKDQVLSEVESLGGKIYVSGDPVMSSAIAKTLAGDLPLVVFLIVIMLGSVSLATRSIHTTIATLMTIAFSIAGAIGSAALFGVSLTPGSTLAIFLIASLSTAFVIHANAYRERNDKTRDIPKEAIVPTLLAGVTTALTFGSTGWTPSPDVRALAIIGVLGIIFATASIFWFVFPYLKSKNKSRSVNVHIPRWVFVKPWFSHLLLIILIGWCSYGLLNVRFEYEAVDYLPQDHPVRIDFNAVGADFGKMHIPLLIDMEINDVEKWSALNALVNELENEGAHVNWFYEHMEVLTKHLTDFEQSFPRNEMSFDQLMLWFEPEDVETLIAEDRSSITINVAASFIGSADYYQLKNKVESFLSVNDIDGRLTGRVSGYFENGHRVGVDNIVGLAMASLVIWLILLFVFRSFLLATIVLGVNTIPAISAIATLGATNVPVDLGSSIVAAIAFGIVIDDSTHLVVRIRRLQSSGFDPSTAVVRAVRELAAPIFFTTVTLCIGFSILFAAEMRPFEDFAMTILISLTTAIIADLVILPTLVRLLVRDPLHSP